MMRQTQFDSLSAGFHSIAIHDEKNCSETSYRKFNIHKCTEQYHREAQGRHMYSKD